MSVSSNYSNAFSREIENFLVPVQRLFRSNMLQSVEVKTRFKVNNEERFNFYNARPYTDKSCPYANSDYENVLLCYHRAIREVTRQAKDPQFLQIGLTVIYIDKDAKVRKVSISIDPEFNFYDLNYY